MHGLDDDILDNFMFDDRHPKAQSTHLVLKILYLAATLKECPPLTPHSHTHTQRRRWKQCSTPVWRGIYRISWFAETLQCHRNGWSRQNNLIKYNILKSSFLFILFLHFLGDRIKGWQFGENLRTQSSGWFPLAYTEVLMDMTDR